MGARADMTDALALEEIRRYQQRGRLEAALQACESACKASPENLDLLALAGTLAAQNMEVERAREILARLESHALFPSLNAAVLTDMAGIHILLGESAAAMRRLEAALRLSPDYLLAIVRRGLVLLQSGYIAPAIVDLTAGLKRLPAEQQAPVLINLARCYLAQSDAAQALSMVEQARQRGAQHREQWVFAAVDCYIALDRWDDAEQAIQEGLQAGIEQNTGLLLWSVVLAAQDKHEEAEHQIRKALRDDPDNAALLTHLANLANVRGHYGEALHCLHRATQLAPDNAALWAQLAQMGSQYFDAQAARHAAEKALSLTKEKLGLDRAQALVAMAHVSADDSHQSEAEQYYRDALAQLPDFIPAQMGLGRLWLQWGRVDDATALFESVAQRHPVAGYGALISARRFPDDDTVLANIERMAHMPSLEGPVKGGLLFDLAAVYEHRKDYDRAFHFAREANQASSHYLPYQASEHREYCRRLQRTFSRDFYRERLGSGHPSTLPVFVCGMPRSGTTLVEQILGGHPDIFVAGEIGMLSGAMQRLSAWEQHVGSGQEYPECVRDLGEAQACKLAAQILDDLRRYDANATHIVDKLPHNFENIGLLRLLFPNAPVIHVLREPRDVAVSNYFTNYQAKFGGMGFAYDLGDIGRHLVDYQQLMRHWDATLAKPVLTLRYEEVVDDTEAAARKMLAYLGLDWTPAVLDHQNLERAVKTASVWQVRQPIYKTAVEKWRRYAAHLAPLEQALAEQPPTPEPASESSPAAGRFFQGMDYLHRNHGYEAEQVFRALLQDQAGHAAAMHMLGVALMVQNRHSDALPYLEASIERHPGHAGWYHNAMLAYRHLGREADALNMHEKLARRMLLEEQR
jgi:tetratricopeptide (TPR) repeat protein